jgi:hypothetical protein
MEKKRIAGKKRNSTGPQEYFKIGKINNYLKY